MFIIKRKGKSIRAAEAATCSLDVFPLLTDNPTSAHHYFKQITS
jgi:hypothetical protein